MKKTYQTLLIFVTLALNLTTKVLGQEVASVSFDTDQWNEHIGVIASASTGQKIGSGFVFGAHKDVVTCAHVLASAENFLHETNLLYLPHVGVIRQLKLKYILPKYDLAVFSPIPEIKGTSKKCGDFKKIRPGDQIIYIGYDTRRSSATNTTCVANEAVVTAIGSALNNGTIIDFLEFDGVGIPGYSGGAVFNQKGELVAVMREAWTKKGLAGGAETLVNRAFSLDILSVLDSQVFSEADSNSQDTNKAAMTLLDVLDLPQASESKTNQPAQK